MSFASNGAHWVAKSVELRITPFPVGGRCRLDVYWNDADQPCPSGIPYWRLRVVIPATGVDATRFAPTVSGDHTRARLGLTDTFVVGWVGSFRAFHGLDTLVDAFARPGCSRQKLPAHDLTELLDERPRQTELDR